MKADNTLFDIVSTRVSLDHQEATGFYKVLCPICLDHGKKGKRAGWKFDGDETIYKCFNCGYISRHVVGERLSKKMIRVLEAFGIDESDLREFAFTNTMSDAIPKFGTEKIKIASEPETIEMPDHFYRLGDDVNSKIARVYLETREIDPKSYSFYVSNSPAWKHRVIYPIYKNDKLIYYQGRDVTGKKTLKYHSPAISKNNVLFGFDKLYRDISKPLFVCEGFFDALFVDGVAIFGNSLSEGQEYWLSSSQRSKIFIPDRWGYGDNEKMTIGEKFLSLGWSVCIPDFGDDVKDINDAVIKYGKLYTLANLRDNIYSGDIAEIKLRIYIGKK